MIKLPFCSDSMRFVGGAFGATRFLLDTGVMSMHAPRPFVTHSKLLAPELMRSHPFVSGIDMTVKRSAP